MEEIVNNKIITSYMVSVTEVTHVTEVRYSYNDGAELLGVSVSTLAAYAPWSTSDLAKAKAVAKFCNGKVIGNTLTTVITKSSFEVLE